MKYASEGMRTIMLGKLDQTSSDYLVCTEQLAHFAQSYELCTLIKRALGQEECLQDNCWICLRSTTQGNASVTLVARGGTFAGSLSRTQTLEGDSAKFLLVVNKVSSKRDDVWILDSVSSRHLVSDES